MHWTETKKLLTSMETDDSGVLLTNVKSTNGAIGYVALSYLTGDAGVETVAIDDVEPTLENTYSGKVSCMDIRAYVLVKDK